MTRIRIEPLMARNEQFLDEYLRRDPVTNDIILMDLHDPYHRKFSRFYLAIRRGELDGYLLIYERPVLGAGISIVWLRGSIDTAKNLLDLLQVERAMLHVDPELAELVKQRLPIEHELEAEFMILDKGSERLVIGHPVRRLTMRNAKALLELSRRIPEFPPFLPEDVERILARGNAFGIFVSCKLVSIASGSRRPLTGLGAIGAVLTDPIYRGHGFATSAVSRVVRCLFEEVRVNQIHLIAFPRNVPAMKVYRKVGFRTHRRLVYLDLRTDLELFKVWGRKLS